MADPDVVVRHAPVVCAGCGDLAGATEVGVARRQVFDIPEPKLVVTEHQIVTVACGCGHRTTGVAPARATAPAVHGPRLAAIGVYLLHGQFLSVSRTAHALRDLFGVPVTAGTVACWVKRTALGVIDKVLPVIRDRISAAPVAHFDETGMRVDARLAWPHSASTATDVPLTAHRKRGTVAMDAAGVLPGFTGVAVHDAWAPYDTYTDAVHALCNAHVLRELVYVVDTTSGQTADLAAQAITALQRLNRLVSVRATGVEPDPAALAEQIHLLRSAVVLGAETTAARASTLQRKYHALFVRLRDRHDDYLRFVTNPAVPFDNNPAEQTIRMPKLRIKVSGSMRTLTGAEHFAAIRSYTTTAARQGKACSTLSSRPSPATPGSLRLPDVPHIRKLAPIQLHRHDANYPGLDQSLDGQDRRSWSRNVAIALLRRWDSKICDIGDNEWNKDELREGLLTGLLSKTRPPIPHVHLLH